MAKRTVVLPVYQVERCEPEWCKVIDSSTGKTVIERVTFGTAKQYQIILNEAYEKGYEKGVEDSPKVELVEGFKFPNWE